MTLAIKQYYKVDKTRIGFLRFIIEAYDNLATMTTVDVDTGLIVLNVATGCGDVATALMRDLAKEFYIEKVD